MHPRPLVAVEDPPDFPAQIRSNRYRIIDTARNRTIGTVRGDQIGRPGERWAWGIGVPPAAGVRALAPSGKEPTRDQALAAMKAAWITYLDEPDWPPRASTTWLEPGAKDGQGPWRPGDEPRGWKPA